MEKMEKQENLIAVGQIVRYQGNKGEVRVVPLTEEPERFFELDEVIIEIDGQPSRTWKTQIEKAREHKGFLVLKLAGVDSIDDADKLKNAYINIPESELPELPQDHFYIYQLIGLKVETETGRQLGRVVKVHLGGGADVLEVQGEGEDEVYMIPAAKEIITEIDQVKKEIVINPPPGLLEL